MYLAKYGFIKSVMFNIYFKKIFVRKIVLYEVVFLVSKMATDNNLARDGPEGAYCFALFPL